MDGIILTPLTQIYNPKGDIFHAMKKTSDGYEGFGEAYFSTIPKGTVKPWKKHKLMTLNIIVPVGKIKFVLKISAYHSFSSSYSCAWSSYYSG